MRRRQSGAAGVCAASPVPPLRPTECGVQVGAVPGSERGPPPLRLSARAPWPQPPQKPLYDGGAPDRVDFLGIVARPARFSGAVVAVYRATNGPAEGIHRGGPVRSTHAAGLQLSWTVNGKKGGI